LAAIELDKCWDGWVATLSKSHEKGLQLIEAGQRAEAHAEFRDHFLVTVREIYSEAVVVCPERFSKSKDWTPWLRRLYALSVAAERTLRGGATSSGSPQTVAPLEARLALEAIRDHFHRLHVETDTRKSNDYLHAFYQQSLKDRPDVPTLQSLRASLDAAAPSLKAKQDPNAYQAAKAEWLNKIGPILADKMVSASEVDLLRSATRAFHHAYGMQIE
jgi:hypothetical protein